jgi:hypothetical protein
MKSRKRMRKSGSFSDFSFRALAAAYLHVQIERVQEGYLDAKKVSSFEEVSAFED